jgi:transposase
MEPRSASANPVWPFPFVPQDWEHTPAAVQASVHTLQDALTQLRARVEALAARLTPNAMTSHRPPSSDAPYQKPRHRTTTPRQAGGKPGHPGHRQALLPPTTVPELRPERCTWGNTTCALPRPYHTHQGLELPPLALEVTHWGLHQGWCPDCGRWSKAQVPAEHAPGYGPRVSALMGERTGTSGNGRRRVQTLWASVLQGPLSLGASQTVLDRVAQASEPHDTALAMQARQAPVNSSDETPWFCTHTLPWLWVMASERVAFDLGHPRRSQEAFAALIDDWAGMLVREGYGVYRHWVARRQTCLAHLIRTARSVAERQHAELAACGTWALTALPRLCHMATAPPTGGEWRAWEARLCTWIDQYQDRADAAGRFARRLLREMDSLWVLLAPHGVEPPTNRAERAWRFGGQWRKRSLGTASAKGNRWGERILSLQETGRLHARSTYQVLVEAVASLLTNQQPDLTWIAQS